MLNSSLAKLCSCSLAGCSSEARNGLPISALRFAMSLSWFQLGKVGTPTDQVAKSSPLEPCCASEIAEKVSCTVRGRHQARWWKNAPMYQNWLTVYETQSFLRSFCMCLAIFSPSSPSPVFYLDKNTIPQSGDGQMRRDDDGELWAGETK